MKKRVSILLASSIFIIILSSVSLSELYYADSVITIGDNGLVTIESQTNHAELNVKDISDYTSKKGKYWTFNISLDEDFSNFIYKINLPKGSSINYMNLPDVGRIEDSNKGLSIIGTGQNRKFEIIVQYKINRFKTPNNLRTYVLILVILFTLFLARNKILKKKKKEKRKIPAMSERQKQIYDILKKNKTPMTQKQIKEKINLPKSSISRNIESMVKKKILNKEHVGMSNKISIKVDKNNDSL